MRLDELKWPVWDTEMERLGAYVKRITRDADALLKNIRLAINNNEGRAIVASEKPTASKQLVGRIYLTQGTGGGGADEVFICRWNGAAYEWNQLV